MPFYVILILCLLGGLTIVFLATWLSTTRGNTISEILNSQKFKDAEAIKLEIADKIKISSTIPIVALYMVGAFVAVGLPSMIYWINSRDLLTLTLSGNVIKEQHKKVFMRLKDMSIEESGHFDIPVYVSKKIQTINIESDDYAPLTMSVEIDKNNNRLRVFFSNSNALKPEEHPIEVGKLSIWLNQDIILRPAPIPTAVNQPSSSTVEAAAPPITLSGKAEYIPFDPNRR